MKAFQLIQFYTLLPFHNNAYSSNYVHWKITYCIYIYLYIYILRGDLYRNTRSLLVTVNCKLCTKYG